MATPGRCRSSGSAATSPLSHWSTEVASGHEASRLTSGRLQSRPRPAAGGARLDAGFYELELAAGEAVAYVSDRPNADRPSPLLLFFHGAGATPGDGLSLLVGAALNGTVVLAPKSSGRTWDEVTDAFGPDVATADEVLAWLFAHHPVDRARMAVAGFSDGASYALSIGLTNGDLFGHVMALSPGFLADGSWRGRPRVFVSHGRRDRVLSIERTRRLIVPGLRAAGYGVTFEEFDGGHEVPPELRDAALGWFLG